MIVVDVRILYGGCEHKLSRLWSVWRDNHDLMSPPLKGITSTTVRFITLRQEIKVLYLEWKCSFSPVPKRFKFVLYAGKVFTPAWGCKRNCDYWLQKEHTINDENYSNLLRKLLKVFKTKLTKNLTKAVLFHQDYTPWYKS